MSWINNALKNAQAARPEKTAPIDSPAPMAVDCPPHRLRGSTFPLMGLIVVVMCLSGFMMWKWFRAGHTEMKVRARSYDAGASPVSAPAPVSADAKKEKSSAVSTKGAIEQKTTDTTVKTPVVAKAPKPIIYKLQGIIYVPGRSSAVINGKTVVAGERVDDAQVAKIDKDTATIVTSTGQTNVLDLQ